MNKQTIQLLLKNIAYHVRVDVVRATTQARSGHVSSCFSATEIGVVLFFYAMRFDRTNPHAPTNDHCIFSKGHAAPLLYALWKQAGVLTDAQLMTLRQAGSMLEGHPSTKFDPIEVATGSLGCGLSVGLGMRLAARIDGIKNTIFVLLGDSECSEGSVWEALQLADYYHVNGLVAIVDINQLGQRGTTMLDDHVTTYEKRFASFGWHTIIIDGHAINQLMDACDQAAAVHNKPVVILARTVKGKGISSIEHKNGFHGVAFKPQELDAVLDELQVNNHDFISDERNAQAKKYIHDRLSSMEQSKSGHVEWRDSAVSRHECSVASQYKCCAFTRGACEPQHVEWRDSAVPRHQNSYEYTQPTATRKAYGDALCTLKKTTPDLMVFDAEVGNSTYALTYAQKYPESFVESFIAEQNMIGMAMGTAAQGKIPFASTFGAFMTRAFDQIRMAGIGKTPVRLVGSHCGVSIGQDGPSQMALEDIAMISTIPDSVILYPSDAVSTHALVQLMASHHASLSYLRLTREDTPLLYTHDHTFKIGGCQVLAQPENAQVLIIAAGITVHEALKAAQELKTKDISVAIIDLYCVKPLDSETIIAVAMQCRLKIITVEDHYLFGGIGQMITSAVAPHEITVTTMAVTHIPDSATPEQQRAHAKINAQTIVETVMNLSLKT